MYDKALEPKPKIQTAIVSIFVKFHVNGPCECGALVVYGPNCPREYHQYYCPMYAGPNKPGWYQPKGGVA
jgi:hypothetical protein